MWFIWRSQHSSGILYNVVISTAMSNVADRFPVPRRPVSALRVLLAVGLTLILAATSATQAQAAAPLAPKPVYSTENDTADPGLVRDGHQYYMYMTGGLAKVATARDPKGPWTALPDALSRWGDWASGKGAVWAPDAQRTSAGWVLYYAAQAKGFAGQRCIGAAVSDHPAGPYEPLATPLICPKADLGGEDLALDRPDQTSGVIDPSPFTDQDGQRYLLYKTQKTPGTIRMFPISADGLHGRGPASHELVRHSDSIENPMMVWRGDYYILIAAANWYDQCAYSTVWRRSQDLWSFADKTEHVLLDRATTGICGPGGADLVTGPGGPTRMVLHGWVCGAQDTPCDGPVGAPVPDPDKRRAIYAAAIGWGHDGATPTLATFIRPGTAHG